MPGYITAKALIPIIITSSRTNSSIDEFFLIRTYIVLHVGKAYNKIFLIWKMLLKNVLCSLNNKPYF